MKSNSTHTKPISGLALAVAVAFGAWGAAYAQTSPATSGASNTNGPTPAEQALALLKPMADRLSAAKSFSFKTESMIEVPSPVGQMIDYFFTSEVGVERPNKLFSRKTGDGPSFDTYYDGKTFSAVDKKLGLFAEMAAPPTLDELIPAVMEKTGLYFPSADFMYSNVYDILTKGLTHAYWVDKSTVNGVVCDHLAFAGPDVEWQIWIGPEKDPLPRRMAVTHLVADRHPRFMMTFSDWKLNPHLAAKDFEVKKPADAKMIEFRPLMTNDK